MPKSGHKGKPQPKCSSSSSSSTIAEEIIIKKHKKHHEHKEKKHSKKNSKKGSKKCSNKSDKCSESSHSESSHKEKLCKGDIVEVRNYESSAGTLHTPLNSGGSRPGHPCFFMAFLLSPDNDWSSIKSKK